MFPSTRSTDDDGLIGRGEERAWLRRLVAGLAAGRGGAVVVTGPAGIGKSALLRDTARSVRSAADEEPAVRVAHVVGAAAEQAWPFAGLHLVLSGLQAAGVLDQGRDLAGRVAGAQSSYDAARNAQELIGGVTEPVLLLVDDAHLLDVQSREVLGFVARRLSAGPVGMVLVADAAAAAGPFQGLHQLRLAELPRDEAVELVLRAGGPHLLRRVATQLASRVGGNPRGLLDVVERIPDAQRRGRAELDRYLPPSPVLQALQLPELDELDEARRFALLVATGGDDANLAAVLRALEGHGEALTAWLLSEHLLPSDTHVVLRRPAVRSLIWQAATPAERARAHEALAAAYGESDRDQRLWQLAQARHEDAELAAELQRAARELRDRGQLERAVAFARAAVRLTPAGDDGVDGLLLTGDLALLTGRVDEAVELSQERFRRDTTPRQRADLALLEVRARGLLDGGVATGLVTRHVAEMSDADPGRAARLALTAAVGMAARMEEAEAARFLSVAEQFAGRVDDATRGVQRRAAAQVASVSGDLPTSLELIAADTALADPFEEAERVIGHAQVLIRAERYGEARELLQVVTAEGRFAESPPLLAAAYSALSRLELRAGRIAPARAAVAAWDRVIAEAVFRATVPAHFIRVHALAGEFDQAWEWRRRAGDGSRRHGDAWTTALALAETGALLLLMGRLDEAVSSLDHARRYALQHADPATMAIEPDFVEACVRAGDMERATAALAEFELRVARAPSAWAQHALRRCQGLVGEGEEAVAVLEAAVGDAVSPVEVARTKLCLAERLRRQGRRLESRRWFQRARVLAHQCGAMALVLRAEEELGASGGPAAAVVQLENLTEAEWRIASLVAAGRRNREIAAELFVSVRTVEVHLGRIYRKVGVRSRTELASAVIVAAGDDGAT